MTDETKKPPGVAERPAATFEAAAPAPQTPRGKKLKVRRIGNSLGVVLPKEVLAKLKVGEGDELTVSETPEGVILSPFDAEVLEQLEAGREAMRTYRNALRELAK